MYSNPRVGGKGRGGEGLLCSAQPLGGSSGQNITEPRELGGLNSSLRWQKRLFETQAW